MRQTTEEIEKVFYLYKQWDALYQLRNSTLSDFNKRTYFRYFFIGIDNFLKIIGWVKNECRRTGRLSITNTKTLEALINTVRYSYDTQYDLIRDKLAAHQQALPLDESITWWNEIDTTTVDVFRDDLSHIRDVLTTLFPSHAQQIVTEHIDFSNEKEFFGLGKIVFDTTRLGLTEPNSVSIVPCHSTQDKAALIAAAIRFLKSDFYLTTRVNNPQTETSRLLFDIGWYLAVIDLTSIIDCIFEDGKEPSLLTLWRQSGIKGQSLLTSFGRDVEIESQMKSTRNKIAAHIDSQNSLSSSYQNFLTLDLAGVHAYAIRLVNHFLNACRADIRTKMFSADGIEIPGAVALPQKNGGRPFDE